MSLASVVAKEQRRFTRVPYVREVCVVDGAAESVRARSCDVGRGGLSVELGRYFRPGRLLMVWVNGREGTSAAELKAEVAWCKPAPTPERFVAGLRVIHDEAESIHTMSELLYTGLHECGALTRLSGYREDVEVTASEADDGTASKEEQSQECARRAAPLWRMVPYCAAWVVGVVWWLHAVAAAG